MRRFDRTIQIVGTISILTALAAGLWYAHNRPASVPPLTKRYINNTYHFGLLMPADFAASDDGQHSPSTGTAIVFKKGGVAVQIVVTPDDNASPNNTFTAADLEREAPYVDPSQAQPVQLASGVTAMTFTEGSYQPDTDSTDVLMFTYRGNLYELSAYTKDHALFEAMMDTWSFQ